MSKVGVIVITRVGAKVCEQELQRLNIEFVSDGEEKESDYIEWVKKSNWKQVAKMIVQSIDQLIGEGADIFIMPSNTPHYAYDFVKHIKPDINFLNLIELSAQACSDAKIKKVAVLGTKQTMQGSLYDDYLKHHGIVKVFLEQNTLEVIDELIFQELIPKGRDADPGIVECARQCIIKMRTSELCDGVILGCTELPVVFDEATLGMPAIDTTRLLAYAVEAHTRLDRAHSNNDY